MIKLTTIKEIANNLDLDSFDYDYIGIRVQKQTEQIGFTISHNSKVWIEGEETQEELNGVSAIDAKTAKYLSDDGGYCGNYIIILGCYYAEGGYDPEEIIMQNAIVLDVKEVV